MPCEGAGIHHRGFTLVELLVAITILAMIAVLGWRGLDSIMRARTTLTADMEQFRGMQLAFAQLQSDCAQIVNAADFPAHPPILATQNGITLMRSVTPDNQLEQFEIVTYRFVNGVLTRQTSRASRDMDTLEQAWRAALTMAEPAATVQVLSGLDTAAMRLIQDPPNGLEVELRIKGRKESVSKTILIGPT